jgi:hypothetical protein
MKTFQGLIACLVAVGLSPPAESRKAKKPTAAAQVQTARAVEELKGEFKWDMTVAEVQKSVLEKLHVDYDARMKATPDPKLQQELKDELARKVKEIYDSYVKFDGQKTGWDVSYIDREFGHKNEESMFYRWEQDQRRFFFFYQDRLYKMVIALPQAKYKGKSFDDFATSMQQRYGRAEPRFSINLAGSQEFDRLVWPITGATSLEAVDHTAFYGNFILVLANARENERIVEGRSINSPKAKARDSALDEALSDHTTGSVIDDDVVDRVTGRAPDGVRGGAANDEGVAAAKPTTKKAPPPPAAKKKKPLSSENPLDGIE